MNNNKTMYFSKKDIKNFYPYYNEVADCDFLDIILKEVKEEFGDIQLCVEPGRVLVNNCGISIYKVEYVKETYDGNIIRNTKIMFVN